MRTHKVKKISKSQARKPVINQPATRHRSQQITSKTFSPIPYLWVLGLGLALAMPLYMVSSIRPAYAQSYQTVTNDDDSGVGSFRNVVSSAPSGDGIRFGNDFTINLLSTVNAGAKWLYLNPAGNNIVIDGTSNITNDSLFRINGDLNFSSTSGGSITFQNNTASPLPMAVTKIIWPVRHHRVLPAQKAAPFL